MEKLKKIQQCKTMLTTEEMKFILGGSGENDQETDILQSEYNDGDEKPAPKTQCGEGCKSSCKDGCKKQNKDGKK